MDTKYTQAVNLLLEKSRQLNGERLPKRSDFSPDDACFIKQKLGPWPRALEKAGLKEKTRPDSIERNREKRAKRKEVSKNIRKEEKEE